MALSDLPDDVLLQIVLSLSIQDVLSFKQTCRVLHAFGSTDYLWHRLIEHSGLLLDISTDTPLTDLTADDLQRHAIQAIRLQLNWCRPSSIIKRITSLGTTSDALFEHLHFVSGGKWLLVVQGLYRRFENRNYTKVSFWNLSHIQDAHCVVQFELVGKHRASAIAMRNEDTSATFTIALNHADRDFIEVRTVLLDEDINVLDRISPLPSIPVARRVEIPSLPAISNTSLSISSVSVSEQVMVATIALIATGEDVTSRTLIALTDAGPARWMDEEPVQPIRLSLTRLHHDTIVIFGNNAEGLLVRLYELPADIFGKRCEKTTYKMSIQTTDGPMAWGPLVKQISYPGLRNPFTDAFPVTCTPERTLTIMYGEGRATNAFGHIVRFTLGPRADGQSSVDSIRVPFPSDTSLRLVSIGASGRRAVWLEHSLETTRSRLMKLELGSAEGTAEQVFHGVLLPPDPPLPFSTDACHSLAFDEATCRLCLGLWDGSLHIVDFL